MNANHKISRVLGAAFLLQFVTSFSSGQFLKQAWLVPGNISETMLKIEEYPWLVKANILVDMLTALGVIFLGAILFITLRKQNEKIALVGLGFYILEAGLLAASRIATFSLIPISQEFATAGRPEYLQTLGNIALESMDFLGDTLHILAFCAGAIIFYTLLYRSRIVPRGLSLWGLITVFLPLAGTLTAIFNYELPFVLFLPYVPFELVLGIWILVKGIPEFGSEYSALGVQQPANV
jgi:hypothetical protein